MSNKLYFKHLEPFRSIEGYWSTTDCTTVAKDIISTTSAKAMLEIGFNIGYSAAVWLEEGITDLYIIDINQHKDTEPAILATKNHYSDKHINWILADSTSDTAKDWDIPNIDIAFIDGGHTYEVCYSDSILAINKGAKWLVFDDVVEYENNGVYKALQELEQINKIELIKSYFMTWTNNGYVVLAKVI